jgi:hypothetical protein
MGAVQWGLVRQAECCPAAIGDLRRFCETAGEKAENMTFTPNRRFRRDYDRLFKKDPMAANVMLLLFELADEQGQVCLDLVPETEIKRIMMARFEDPRAYQLKGGARV